MTTVINLGEMSQTYYFSIDFWKFGGFFFFRMMKSAMLSVRFM